MIVLIAVLVAMGTGLLLGGRISGVGMLRLRGEALLLALLAWQLAAPSLRLSGLATDVLRITWLATFPVMFVVAAVNWRVPGMLVLSAGLALNSAVVLANGGMPVDMGVAALAAGRASAAIGSTDYVHLVSVSATRLKLLADVLPMSGPLGISAVVSVGDLLLLAGLSAVLVGAMRTQEGDVGT